MAGADHQKQLLTLIRDFAAEKSQGGDSSRSFSIASILMEGNSVHG